MDEEVKIADGIPPVTGTGNAPGAGPAGPELQNSGQVTFTAEQQAAIDRAIGERLKRAREKWEEEHKAAAVKAAEDAEAERLKAQQQFRELSEKQATRLKELEALPTELERYKTALVDYAAKARAGLPESILPLLEKLDPVEQLAYLVEHGASLQKGGAGQVPATPGAAKGALTDEDRRKKAASVRRVW